MPDKLRKELATASGVARRVPTSGILFVQIWRRFFVVVDPLPMDAEG